MASPGTKVCEAPGEGEAGGGVGDSRAGFWRQIALQGGASKDKEGRGGQILIGP